MFMYVQHSIFVIIGVNVVEADHDRVILSIVVFSIYNSCNYLREFYSDLWDLKHGILLSRILIPFVKLCHLLKFLT